MRAEDLLYELEHSQTNSKRWELYRYATSTFMKDLILSAILRHTHCNDESWQIVHSTENQTVRGLALVRIAICARTIVELNETYIHAPSNIREGLLGLFEAGYTSILARLPHDESGNEERWSIFEMAYNEQTRECALAAVLRYTQSVSEVWLVYFAAETLRVKEKAFSILFLPQKNKIGKQHR